MNFFNSLFKNKKLGDAEESLENTGCIKCKNLQFEYDSYCSEYICQKCGWSVKKRPDGNINIINKEVKTANLDRPVSSLQQQIIQIESEMKSLKGTIKAEEDKNLKRAAASRNDADLANMIVGELIETIDQAPLGTSKGSAHLWQRYDVLEKQLNALRQELEENKKNKPSKVGPSVNGAQVRKLFKEFITRPNEQVINQLNALMTDSNDPDITTAILETFEFDTKNLGVFGLALQSLGLVRDPRSIEYLMERFDALSKNAAANTNPQLRSIAADHLQRAAFSIVNLIFNKRDSNPKAIPYLIKIYDSNFFPGEIKIPALKAIEMFEDTHPEAKVTDKLQSQQSQEHQKTVAEVVSKAILKSEGQLEGMAALEYIDVIRAICNSGFSEESIDKGLHHSNYKIRALVKEFLQDI